MTTMPDARTTPSPVWDMRDTVLIGSGLVIAAVAAIAAQVSGIVKIQAAVGLIVILLIAYLWSTNRRAIDRRTVAWGLSLQAVFALIVLKTTVGRWTFAQRDAEFKRRLGLSGVCAALVFGVM